MNEALLTRNLWLEYIFLGLPATILIIKMILEHVFSKIKNNKEIIEKRNIVYKKSITTASIANNIKHRGGLFFLISYSLPSDKLQNP